MNTQRTNELCLFLLFLVFMTLKLTHHIDWSWWWVTAPLWVPMAVFLVALAVIAVVAWVLATLGVP
jgi:Transmembrane Fragile-X-F protein